MVPDGVATNVMTSQSMVLSGDGASVSEMTPKKLERLFFTFSVVSEEPSTWEVAEIYRVTVCACDGDTNTLSGENRNTGELTASLFLTAEAVAAIEQAVSCCTTVENSVRSRFRNSKASVDCEGQSSVIKIKIQIQLTIISVGKFSSHLNVIQTQFSAFDNLKKDNDHIKQKCKFREHSHFYTL